MRVSDWSSDVCSSDLVFRRDGSDQGVSPCDISRNIMPTPGADAVAELPQLSPECNNSNGVGRIGVALERPSGDLGGGPIRKNREFTMRTSQSLSILAITTALATTGWAIPAAAQDEGARALDASAPNIVTRTPRTDPPVADPAVPTAVIPAASLATPGPHEPKRRPT